MVNKVARVKQRQEYLKSKELCRSKNLEQIQGQKKNERQTSAKCCKSNKLKGICKDIRNNMKYFIFVLEVKNWLRVMRAL